DQLQVAHGRIITSRRSLPIQRAPVDRADAACGRLARDMPPNLAPVDLSLPILSHASLGASHHLLTLGLRDSRPASAPAQFGLLSMVAVWDPAARVLRRLSSSLNRPGSPAGAPQVLYKVLGRGTDHLPRARPGQSFRCLFPLGNGFSPERPAGSRLMLVAGGIG